MATEKERDPAGVNQSRKAYDLSKSLSSHFADELLVLLALAFAAPTQLSLVWGAIFLCLGIAFIAWEYGYQKTLPLIVGPYRVVRNPHSLALWLVSLSFSIASRSFAAVVLSLIIMVWLYYVDHEENSRKIDAKLLRYRYRVPALIPTLIPFEGSPNQKFSWRRAVKIQKWPSQSRLLGAALAWVYLLVSFNFRLPLWSGLIVGSAYFGIKLLSQKRKYLRFGFRKKA